jgi:hypothetical protein
LVLAQREIFDELERNIKERNKLDEKASALYVKSDDVKEWAFINENIKEKDKRYEYLKNKLHYTTMAALKK